MGAFVQSLRSVLLGPWGSGDRELARILGGGAPPLSGVTVTEQNALTISAVWAAVRLISESVASLPLHLYKRLPNGGKDRFTGHTLYRVLHDEPNPEMSSMTFRETLQAHVLTWGNGYAEIVRDGAGRVAQLWPLHPADVSAERDQRGILRYRVYNGDGTQTILAPAEVFHLRGLSGDGVIGYSPIRMARESLGLTAATEKFGASFFGNGAKPGGVLEHPRLLTEQAKKTLRESLEGLHRGVGNAHRVAILEEGMKYHAISIPPDDAQFLETRKFQITEIARWFNLPVHKLREMDNSSVRANIEQEAIDFVVHTLRPWLRRWEEEIHRSLIAPLERTQQFAEHLIDGLLRGDIASRYSAYAVGRQWGWLSQNDVRERENMNPIADGDLYLVPTNMVPANRVDEVIDAQVRPEPAPVAPAPAPEPEPEEDDDDAAGRAAFLEHVIPRLDDLARRLDALTVPSAEAVAAALRADLAATDGRVDAVADLIRQRDEGARGAVAETLAKLEALAAQVGALEARAEQEATARAEEVTLLRQDIGSLPAPPEPPAPPDLTPILERLDAAEERRRELAARIGALTPTLRDVIEAALRKETRFEADRARKAAAQGPERFRAWLEAFYATREDSSTQFVLPAMRLHFTLLGRADDAEAETRRLIGRYVETSRAALAAVLARSPERLEADVRALVERWESERPRALADELMQEVIAHAA